MNPVIELNGLAKTRGDFRIGPLDLTLDSGLIVALVGPNGSGKSTLLRMMMNLLHPDEGALRLFGETYDNEETAIKRQIGFVGDGITPFHESMTVAEWKAFVSRWQPSWNEDVWRHLRGIFSLPTNKKLKELSAGMVKRVAFAAALSHRPRLLLLDEPSSGMDPFAWRIMMDEIQAFMKEADRTVLIATHIMEEVRRLADLIIFLYDGRILGTFEKDRLLDEWKTFWVRRPGDKADADWLRLPGVVSAEPAADGTMKLVTNRSWETEARLRENGYEPTETRAIELEDILWHLLKQEQQKTNGSKL